MKAPNWAPNAVPTKRGWVHPKTGELLAARKISMSDLNEWYADQGGAEVVEPTPLPPTPPQPLGTPSGYTETELLEMFDGDKDALDIWAEERGVELDKRKSFSNMVKEFFTKQ
jgi:hypothetical protein